jgi:hypothetical protein
VYSPVEILQLLLLMTLLYPLPTQAHPFTHRAQLPQQKQVQHRHKQQHQILTPTEQLLLLWILPNLHQQIHRRKHLRKLPLHHLRIIPSLRQTPPLHLLKAVEILRLNKKLPSLFSETVFF